MKRYLFFVVLVLAFHPLSANAGSIDWTKLNPELSDATYVKDDKKCVECHEEFMAAYDKTAHAKAFKYNSKTGMEGIDCEICHGPMSKHLDAPRKTPPLLVPFKKNVGLTAQQKSAICLQCHEKGKSFYWDGGAHDRAGLSCDNCHTIGGLSRVVKVEVCYSCHPQIRALFQRTSHIPVREGKITCSDCHNPHGSKGPSLLHESTANNTCYGCHAEKRGPFLWEHAPVRENCLNCHNPHGSNQPNLLKTRVPFLCQQCHLVAGAGGHPSTANSGPAGSEKMLGKGCLNCHSQMHGSNHPSGAKFVR